MGSMGSRRVDDTDPSLGYSGCLHCDWFQLPHEQGAFEETLTATTKSDVTLTFFFAGTGVSVYGAAKGSGLKAPWGTSHYIVDNDASTEGDYTPQDGGPLEQILFYQSPPLTKGGHMLVITNTIENRPLAIDYISVTNSAGPEPTKSVGPLSTTVVTPVTKPAGSTSTLSATSTPSPPSPPSSPPPSPPPSPQDSSTHAAPGPSASSTGSLPPSSPTDLPTQVRDASSTSGATTVLITTDGVTVTSTEAVAYSNGVTTANKGATTKNGHGSATKKGSTASTPTSVAGALASTSTTSQTSSEAKHGPPIGAVIGGVVAALLLLAAALAAFFYIRRKRRARAIRLSTEDEKGLNAPGPGSEVNSARSSRATLGASVTSLLSPTDTRWRASFESTSTSTSATSERTFKGRDVMFRAL